MRAVKAAWQRLRLLEKLDQLETAHAADPRRMKAALLEQLGAHDRSTSQSFRELSTGAQRGPIDPAIAAQLAAAKAELGVN